MYASLPILAQHWDGPVYAVDSLELWRQRMGLPKMVLLGHSIGGYLSVAYAERHAEHLERVILASPVGLPAPDAPEVREEKLKNAPWFFRLASSLWSKGWTPYHVIRNGPGRLLLSGYTNRRFEEREWIDKKTKGLFTEYV